MFFNLFGKNDKNNDVLFKSNLNNIEHNNVKQDIKNGIDKIKSANLTEEKVLIAKDFMLCTEIIKDENVLCKFDDERWYNEENGLKKYLEYKSTTSTVYNGVDCDVSLMCITMYILLNENFKLTDIVNQYSSMKKYEIRNNGNRYKGDTLTSALHPLKRYLGCLWKRIDSNEQLKHMKKYREFYGLFQTVARTGVPVAPTGDWNTYCYEHSNIIWNAMDKEAKQFLKSYNMFGNYMCIPGNSYQISEKMWISFNMARSNMGKWDTVDTLLAKIYAYYKYGDSTYLMAVFTNKKEELTKDTLQWLKEFNSWSDFIEKNELLSFVDKMTTIPISMKTGSAIDVNEVHNYDAIPRDYQEFLTFFGQVSKGIALRNESIYKKLALMRSK